MEVATEHTTSPRSPPPPFAEANDFSIQVRALGIIAELIAVRENATAGAIRLVLHEGIEWPRIQSYELGSIVKLVHLSFLIVPSSTRFRSPSFRHTDIVDPGGNFWSPSTIPRAVGSKLHVPIDILRSPCLAGSIATTAYRL
jgi:hypothetical protein